MPIIKYLKKIESKFYLQECVLFSVYTSDYQFGVCQDCLEMLGVTSRPSSAVQFYLLSSARTAGGVGNCLSCVHMLGCGCCHSAGTVILSKVDVYRVIYINQPTFFNYYVIPKVSIYVTVLNLLS